MDPADSDQLRAAIRSQNERLLQQEDLLSAMQHGVAALSSRQDDFKSSVTTQVNHLAEQIHRLLAHLTAESSSPPPVEPTSQGSTRTTSVPTVVSHVSPLRLAPPEKFSGDSGDCRPFLVQCDLHFQHQPAAFPTDQSKVAFMVSHLTGRAAAWATAEWSRGSTICESLGLFKDSLKKIFDHTSSGREAARALSKLRQGHRSVSDFAIEFRTIAADSGWNPLALFDAFINGLSDPIKDQLAPLDLPEHLDSVIAMAVRIDNRLRDRKKEKTGAALSHDHHQGHSSLVHPPWRDPYRPPPPPRTAPPDPSGEPMQLGRARLSAEERRRRLQEGRCFYCGQLGHLLSACPVKGGARQ